MIIARRNIRLLFAAVIIICGVTLLMLKDNNTQKETSINKAPISDIDFFISNAVFTAFDSEGKIIQLATADKIDHFKQDKYSSFNQPIIHKYQNSAKIAAISSKTAISQDDDNTITFYNNVIVNSFEENSIKSELKTEALSYNRAINHLSTNEDIEITDTLGNITTATGLASDLNLETIHLKKNVKGTLNAK